MKQGVTSFAYSIKISIICFVFILSVIASIGAETRSDDYYEVIDTKIGMNKSISGYQMRTILQCADKCTSLSSCKSFLWDPLGGICTLGTHVKPNGIRTASGSKKLFTRRFKCRYDMGFQLRQYGAFVRCLYISGLIAGYYRAKEECHNRGGRLFKANALDLISMLIKLASDEGIPANGVIFIGLDDRDNEDNFKWSDGQPLTTEERKQLFEKGEPNNHGRGQDCVALNKDTYLLDDTGCWGQALIRYACEMDI